MAKCCAPVTRSSSCIEDRIPAGPFCYPADSLPVRTNAGLWKINLSHSHDNMFPQVMMRRQFWRIRQGQLLISSVGRMSITSNSCLSVRGSGTREWLMSVHFNMLACDDIFHMCISTCICHGNFFYKAAVSYINVLQIATYVCVSCMTNHNFDASMLSTNST